MTFAAKLSATVLAAVHAAAALAGFLAPYDPSMQHRDYPHAAPSRIALRERTAMAVTSPRDGVEVAAPIEWLSRKQSGLRLLAVEEPGKIFLLGTDALGRDQWSRLLHGARVSLFLGLSAAVLSALLGTALGLLAGYHLGWSDRIVMKLAEVSLAIPWLYLLLAIRAGLPLDTTPVVLLAGIVAAMVAAGWGRPARLVRGVALSVRERQYVSAARGFGAGPGYILIHHVLPAVRPTVVQFLCLAAPQFVLAEVTFSFLGLGLSEPFTSWGEMLAAFSRLDSIVAAPWMCAPGIALALTSLCYHTLLSSRAPYGSKPGPVVAEASIG